MVTVHRDPNESPGTASSRMTAVQVLGEDGTDSDASSDSDDLVTDSAVMSPPDSGGPTPAVESFGHIKVTDSTDVQIGHNKFFQGPVTITEMMTMGDLESAGTGNERRKIMNSDNNSASANGGKGAVNEGFEADLTPVKTTKLDNGVFILTKDDVAVEESDIRRGIRYLQNIPPVHRFLILICSGIILITFILLIVLVIVKHQNSVPSGSWQDSDEINNNTPIDAPNTTVTVSDKLRIISRVDWSAKPPKEPANNLTIPVPYIIFHHTATEPCIGHNECHFQCLQIQKFHMDSNKWWDIGYNFLVGGDGWAYEARGWYKQGAHLFSYNEKSIGIAFIGTFDTVLPPERQLTAAKNLVKEAETLGVVTKDFKILTARQLSTTISPGQMLHDEISTWPHWSETP